MNLRVLAGGLAIAVAGVLGHGIYQITPMGEPLARSEVIGELDGPALASYAGATLQRYGDRQLLTGQLLASTRDLDGLRDAPVLQAGRVASETRNLVYGGRGTGVFGVLGTVSGDTDVSLIGTPQGETLYLATSAIDQLSGGGQSVALDVMRSDDLGTSWEYDPQAVLGPPRRHTVFLSRSLVIALDRHGSGARLLHSCDGARHWSAAALKGQIWPDAHSLERASAKSPDAETPTPDQDRLAYGWSLYPLDDNRAVGWSWRMRVQPDGQDQELLETRRFEVRFQEGASPAFRVTPAVLPAPPQKPDARLMRDGPVFETASDGIYELDKAELAWNKRAVSPKVRGTKSWIDQAWFGRNAWVIKTYADHMFWAGERTKTYFYTRDQGQTWHPFQLSPAQERGLLGLDDTGDALLSLAERGGRTVILRYPLD